MTGQGGQNYSVRPWGAHTETYPVCRHTLSDSHIPSIFYWEKEQEGEEEVGERGVINPLVQELKQIWSQINRCHSSFTVTLVNWVSAQTDTIISLMLAFLFLSMSGNGTYHRTISWPDVVVVPVCLSVCLPMRNTLRKLHSVRKQSWSSQCACPQGHSRTKSWRLNALFTREEGHWHTCPAAGEKLNLFTGSQSLINVAWFLWAMCEGGKRCMFMHEGTGRVAGAGHWPTAYQR